MKQIEKCVFCFALMCLLHGCSDTTERLVMESTIIRSCLQPQRNFNQYGPYTVDKPIIILRKNYDNNGWKILYYSEKNRLDSTAIVNLRTVVLVKDEKKPTNDEYSYGRGGTVKLRLYNANLTFIDLTNRAYFDRGINTSPPYSTTYSNRDHFATRDEIIGRVMSEYDYYERIRIRRK